MNISLERSLRVCIRQVKKSLESPLKSQKKAHLTDHVFFFAQQVRVMLLYHANWLSVYFDLFAFSLSTADPFVHPVTCMLVSQRYRAGYKAAWKDILSKCQWWILRFACKSKVKVHVLEHGGSCEGLDSLSNHGSWKHETRRTRTNKGEKLESLSGIPSILRLGAILEVQEETQD